MMNGEGLLECPFCSGDALITNSQKEYAVECQDCGCNTGWWLRSDTAVKSWNTRAGHLFTEQDYKDMNEERKNDYD